MPYNADCDQVERNGIRGQSAELTDETLYDEEADWSVPTWLIENTEASAQEGTSSRETSEHVDAGNTLLEWASVPVALKKNGCDGENISLR